LNEITTQPQASLWSSANPPSGLIANARGDLFGTTALGGNGLGDCGDGLGTVFEIAKTANGYASTPVTMVSFDGTNGAKP
jgi:hypothetical protein